MVFCVAFDVAQSGLPSWRRAVSRIGGLPDDVDARCDGDAGAARRDRRDPGDLVHDDAAIRGKRRRIGNGRYEPRRRPQSPHGGTDALLSTEPAPSLGGRVVAVDAEAAARVGSAVDPGLLEAPGPAREAVARRTARRQPGARVPRAFHHDRRGPGRGVRLTQDQRLALARRLHAQRPAEHPRGGGRQAAQRRRQQRTSEVERSCRQSSFSLVIGSSSFRVSSLARRRARHRPRPSSCQVRLGAAIPRPCIDAQRDRSHPHRCPAPQPDHRPPSPPLMASPPSPRMSTARVVPAPPDDPVAPRRGAHRWPTDGPAPELLDRYLRADLAVVAADHPLAPEARPGRSSTGWRGLGLADRPGCGDLGIDPDGWRWWATRPAATWRSSAGRG